MIEGLNIMGYRKGGLELDLSQVIDIEIERLGSEDEFLCLTLVLDDVKKPSSYYGSKNVTPYTRKKLLIKFDEFKSLSFWFSNGIHKDEPFRFSLRWKSGKNSEGKKVNMDPRRMIKPLLKIMRIMVNLLRSSLLQNVLINTITQTMICTM
jgi:hypothetical protein